MSIHLDVVCEDPQTTALERQEKMVQVIGEILPFVLGKYGIDRSDCRFESTRRFPQGFDYSI